MLCILSSLLELVNVLPVCFVIDVSDSEVNANKTALLEFYETFLIDIKFIVHGDVSLSTVNIIYICCIRYGKDCHTGQLNKEDAIDHSKWGKIIKDIVIISIKIGSG